MTDRGRLLEAQLADLIELVNAKELLGADGRACRLTTEGRSRMLEQVDRIDRELCAESKRAR